MKPVARGHSWVRAEQGGYLEQLGVEPPAKLNELDDICDIAEAP
jgi:hypothetical protein